MFGNGKGCAMFYIDLLLNEKSNRRAIIDCLIEEMLAWQENLELAGMERFGWKHYSGGECPVKKAAEWEPERHYPN